MIVRPEVGVTCEALHWCGQWVRVKIVDRMVGSPSCACRDENDRLWWATDFRQVTNRGRTKSWDGEDLPPVGTACEVREVRITPANAFEDWSKCTIVAYNTGSGGDPQVCTIDDRGDFAIFYPATDGTEFRPIRTPEQIAADQRDKAVSEMGVIALSGENELVKTRWLQNLYDAGYRKP